MKPNILPTFLTPQQDRLLQFVILMHGDQKRKYTGEPYWYHVVNVAYRADVVAGRLGIEVALCHDLIEDTDCTKELLYHYLIAIGYFVFDAEDIVNNVDHLTDKFTPQSHPHLNRCERKQLEAERLWAIPVLAQNVKYCDLEDNTDSIVECDPEFSKIYLDEKLLMLQGMNQGDSTVYEQLVNSFNQTDI